MRLTNDHKTSRRMKKPAQAWGTFAIVSCRACSWREFLAGIVGLRSDFETGQEVELRIGHGDGLEQAAHAGAILAGEAHERRVDGAGIFWRRGRLERGRALLDAEPAQELALRQRSVHPRAHSFRRLRQ